MLAEEWTRSILILSVNGSVYIYLYRVIDKYDDIMDFMLKAKKIKGLLKRFSKKHRQTDVVSKKEMNVNI